MTTSGSGYRARVTLLLIGCLVAPTLIAVAPAAALQTESQQAETTRCDEGEATSIAVTSTELDSETWPVDVINVTGTLMLCNDALGPVVLADDPEGDALVSGFGLDLGKLTVRADLSARQLTFVMQFYDGIPETGNAPLSGYQWPIKIDGKDDNRWLGAGSAGSNYPPRAESWTAICWTRTGWNCDDDVPGAITSSEVRWNIAFDATEPRIKRGSVIEAGGIHCGANPCSFHWPSVLTAGTFPIPPKVDVIDEGWAAYKVPGEIKIAIAPADVPEDQLTYRQAFFESFSPTDGSFSGVLAAPAASGNYNVWVKSCYGLAESPTCVTDSTPFEVPAASP